MSQPQPNWQAGWDYEKTREWCRSVGVPFYDGSTNYFAICEDCELVSFHGRSGNVLEVFYTTMRSVHERCITCTIKDLTEVLPGVFGSDQ